MGCAFAACLERKQKREKECGVTATFDANRTTFTREGSFRVTTATEAAEREEVMRQLQDAKKGIFISSAVETLLFSDLGNEAASLRTFNGLFIHSDFQRMLPPRLFCLAAFLERRPSLNRGDGREGHRELGHRRDQLLGALDGKLPVPLVLAAALRVRAGTPGDPAQARAGRGARQAGLLPRLPGPQSEDVSLQAADVAAHERAALHRAAQVRLPRGRHG